MASPDPVALPPHDTVIVVARGSPLFPINGLAVAPDGTLALENGCNVFLLEVVSGDERRLDGCEGDPPGKHIADLYWLDNELLGLFDARVGEIRVLDKNRGVVGRQAIRDPGQGVLLRSAFPVGPDSRLVSYGYTPGAIRAIRSQGDRFPQLLQLHVGPDDVVGWSDLSPGSVGEDPSLRNVYGVDACVQQGNIRGAYAVLNPWAYDLYIGRLESPGEMWHSELDLGLPHMVRSARGELGPASGGGSVGCSKSHAVAVSELRGESLFGRPMVSGVLELIHFEGRIERRVLLDETSVIHRLRGVGLDQSLNLFGVIADSARHLIIRQPLGALP